jgi:hypothetical protein
MSNATAGEGSPSQNMDQWTPSNVSAPSFLSDKTIEDEGLVFADEDHLSQRRRHDDDIHGLRISHSRLLLGLALVWVFVILAVVLLQGFGQWFTPISLGYIHLSFELSDAVVIAFITSTTATVLGLYGIAAYWLYGNSKKRDATTVQSIEA